MEFVAFTVLALASLGAVGVSLFLVISRQDGVIDRLLDELHEAHTPTPYPEPVAVEQVEEWVPSGLEPGPSTVPTWVPSGPAQLPPDDIRVDPWFGGGDDYMLPDSLDGVTLSDDPAHPEVMTEDGRWVPLQSPPMLPND